MITTYHNVAFYAWMELQHLNEEIFGLSHQELESVQWNWNFLGAMTMQQNTSADHIIHHSPQRRFWVHIISYSSLNTQQEFCSCTMHSKKFANEVQTIHGVIRSSKGIFAFLFPHPTRFFFCDDPPLNDKPRSRLQATRCSNGWRRSAINNETPSISMKYTANESYNTTICNLPWRHISISLQ